MEKHGVVLSHHRLLAASDLDLLRSYEDFYSKLTLELRVLSLKDREIVWAGLTAATREVYGAVHIKRGEAAGLSQQEIANAVAIAAAVEAYPVLDGFAAVEWSKIEDPDLVEQRYLDIVKKARGELNERISELCALVCQAAHNRLTAMTFHIGRFFQAGGSRDELAEALSFLLFHCGGPALIHAVDVWAEAARERGYPPPYPLD
ncbi:MAG: carboxymuconolactone decarboxylase family protein [Pseudomonadota bacterium]